MKYAVKEQVENTPGTPGAVWALRMIYKSGPKRSEVPRKSGMLV